VRRTTPLLCTLFAACALPHPAEEPRPAAAVRAAQARPAPRVEPVAEFGLAPGWETLAAHEFEKLLLGATADGAPRDPDAALQAALERALAAGGAPALRAVLILARARGPRAGERLLALLEAPAAQHDAQLLELAALALGRGTSAQDAARRLGNAAGTRTPHGPAVRVACAASALDLGWEPAVALLLEALERPPAWGLDEARSAALETTAAEALARYAGTRSRYVAWAALAERSAERQRLAALCAARARAASPASRGAP